MSFGKTILVCAALSLSFTGQSFAGSWKFNVINKSAAKVLSFQTKENGDWSHNWLGENIAPGETFVMDFGTAEGECSVRTHITFNDNTYVDSDIDYCKVSNIYVTETGITMD
jgi:hypothetical protein